MGQRQRLWLRERKKLRGDLEGAHESLINTHHRASVVKLSTVVRSWEQGHQLTLGKELIAVLYHLSITQTTHTHYLYHLSITQTTHTHYLYHLSITQIIIITIVVNIMNFMIITIIVQAEISDTNVRNSAVQGHCTQSNVTHLQLQLTQSCPDIFKRHLEQRHHLLAVCRIQWRCCGRRRQSIPHSRVDSTVTNGSWRKHWHVAHMHRMWRTSPVTWWTRSMRCLQLLVFIMSLSSLPQHESIFLCIYFYC